MNFGIGGIFIFSFELFGNILQKFHQNTKSAFSNIANTAYCSTPFTKTLISHFEFERKKKLNIINPQSNYHVGNNFE